MNPSPRLPDKRSPEVQSKDLHLTGDASKEAQALSLHTSISLHPDKIRREDNKIVLVIKVIVFSLKI